MIRRPLVWDASSLLNVLATDRAIEILSSMRRECYVPRMVLGSEVLYLRSVGRSGLSELAAVETQPLIRAGALIPIDPFPEEGELYVEFAAQLDDGEAQCLAIAVSRGYCLATDDRAAVRVARNYAPPVEVIQTPEWLRLWAETTPGADVGELVGRVADRANYRASRSSVHYDWWQEHLT